MKRNYKILIALSLLLVMVLTFTSCSSAPLLKGNYFSKPYKEFIKGMREDIPVSVEFEQYRKTEGFSKDKLITDTDSERIRELVEALAQIKIIGEVESAENFAVRYYAFTDKAGDKYVFEFVGSYLKVENRFYQTENYINFINQRLYEEKSGTLLVALDEAHEGRGADLGKKYISCRELEEQNASLKAVSFGDYELSESAEIIAPVSHDAFKSAKKVSPEDFFYSFEQVKGQDNANYIFEAEIEKGVIVSLKFNYELSQKSEL